MIRLALPSEITAGYWDRCPFCDQPVFMPVAGGKESKAPVKCPACSAVMRPEC